MPILSLETVLQQSKHLWLDHQVSYYDTDEAGEDDDDDDGYDGDAVDDDD